VVKGRHRRVPKSFSKEVTKSLSKTLRVNIFFQELLSQNPTLEYETPKKSSERYQVFIQERDCPSRAGLGFWKHTLESCQAMDDQVEVQG